MPHGRTVSAWEIEAGAGFKPARPENSGSHGTNLVPWAFCKPRPKNPRHRKHAVATNWAARDVPTARSPMRETVQRNVSTNPAALCPAPKKPQPMGCRVEAGLPRHFASGEAAAGLRRHDYENGGIKPPLRRLSWRRVFHMQMAHGWKRVRRGGQL